ncbi:MAG: GerAB/ArcD/ProY family transporter [Acutalibacteraceae bacterium]|nr:GerAB/ArcD/ProY family transporter [Acutalibacteraceae bacterium]
MKPFVRVSVSQLFIMLFISRMVVNVTYSSYTSDTHSLRYGAVSAVVSLAVTLLMLVPVYLMFKTNNGRTVTDNSYLLFKKWGAIIAVIYGLYFLWVLINTLSQFNIMVTNVLNPTASVLVLSLAVVVVSMYGAYKGIEALGRASTVIFAFISVALVILLCTLLAKADYLNLEPITFDNVPEITETVLSMISKNACITAMALLLPFASGKTKSGAVWWTVAVYISTAVIVTLITAVLGDYIETQVFPVYSVTAVASLGVTKRLDGLFLGVWTAGMFVKISLFIYLLSACVKRIFGETISRWSILICGALVLVVAMWISSDESMYKLIFNNYILLCFTLLTGVIIPIFLAIVNKIKSIDKRNYRKE